MTTRRFLFQRLVQEGIENKFQPGATQESREWFREQAGKLRDIRPQNLMRRPGATRNAVSTIFEPGEFYLFSYNPKNKDTLPYYDRFPLALILDVYPGGFLALNFHYIPPIDRARLMDSLYKVATDKEFDEQTKLRVTYDIVKSIGRTKYFKPCVKRYLNNHVKSRYIKIHPAEWDIVLMLPLDRFEGAKRTRVYTDSRKQYN